MLEEIIELEKRYNKTWIWAKMPKSDWKLFHINQVQETGIDLNNQEVGDIFLKAQTDAELEVRWPENKFFNFEDTVYWGYKIPDRQWKRAPCSKNFGFTRTCDQLFGSRTNRIFHEQLIHAAFVENEPTSILEIVNSLKKTDITARAHGKNFAVSLPPVKKDFYILWYNNRPVAEIHVPQKEIVVKYPYLKQEILDFNRDYELNTWNLK